MSEGPGAFPAFIPAKPKGTAPQQLDLEEAIEQAGGTDLTRAVAALEREMGDFSNPPDPPAPRRRGLNKPKAETAVHEPKYTLSEAMALLRDVHDEDLKAIDRCRKVLDELRKPQRDRVLGFLTRVYG